MFSHMHDVIENIQAPQSKLRSYISMETKSTWRRILYTFSITLLFNSYITTLYILPRFLFSAFMSRLF